MPNLKRTDIINRVRVFFNSSRGIQFNLWLSYFIYWAGAAAVVPYISVYYESVNLKGTQIGILNSIPFFVTMISGIIFSFISDVFKQHKTVLRLCTLGLIVILALYPIANGFHAFLPLAFMSSLINAPFNAIMDQTTLSSLKNPKNYGKIRVGGSIGWGLMVLATGFLVDSTSLGLKIIFYAEIFFLLMFFINTTMMPDVQARTSSSDEKPSFKLIIEMLRIPGFMPFLVTMVIWGMGEAAIVNFLFLHIKSLGGSSTLMGTALSVSLIGEIIAFSIADKLQVKIGPRRMVLLSFIVLFTWLTGLSLIRNPNAIPLFQVFGGSGYALLQSGSVAYVNKRAPKELGTTAQAIRGGIYSGLGVGIGTLVSGIIFERSGSIALFRNMSYVVLAGFALGVFLFLRNRQNDTE